MTQPTISLSPNGLSLLVHFPARDSGAIRSHTVRIPIHSGASFKCKHHVPGRKHGTQEPCEECNQYKENKTVAALVSMLKERDRVEREESRQAKLNEAGEPTQALIDAFFSSGGKIEDEATRQERLLEEKYGDQFGDLLELIKGRKES